MQRSISLVLLALGYCVIRCASPALAKHAHELALDYESNDCNSGGEPCAFSLCPGELFRALCDQFSLLNTDLHPLKLKDVSSNSSCCKGKDCSHLANRTDCSVPTNELISILSEATTCFSSPNCIIKHPETLLKLEDKFCNMTMKMLTGFYYCN